MTPADTIPAPVDAATAEAVGAAVRVVRARIAAAAARAGRDGNTIRLIAVSKTVDAAGARCLYDAGVQDLGENRVVEGASKAQALAGLPGGAPVWHCIGHLQRNKARRAVEAFAVIHAVDSPRLLETLDRVAGEVGRRPVCLLQANVAGEAQKYGVPPERIPALAEAAAGCANLQLAGLMTIAPLLPAGDGGEGSRRWFAALRELRDRTVTATGVPLPELSMGMTQDFDVAVEEGATLLRVGTALTGPLRAAA